jgi:putative spermidine/putrescine transport system substrate-binding protein
MNPNGIPSRRTALRRIASGAMAISAPLVWTPSRAAEILRVSDPGGVYTLAWTEAYYAPFAKETNVQVTPVPRRANPAIEFKEQVETRNYNWDLCGGINSDVAELLETQKLLDPIDITGPDMSAVPAEWKTPFYFSDSSVTFVLAYRSDRFKSGLTSFADIWDVEKYPGRRGMRKLARDMIEVALRADGVKGGADIYKVLSTPAGWDRAYNKLDQVRKHVQVWWDSSPRSAQLLQAGEVEICPTFNARAQSAAQSGSPVAISWNGGFYSQTGWCIPKGGPKADLARKFIKFCARADRQAAYTAKLPNGPSNPEAYKFIPKNIAVQLPTHPDNLKVTTLLNDDFWSKNKSMSDKRFQDWLLRS